MNRASSIQGSCGSSCAPLRVRLEESTMTRFTISILQSMSTGTGITRTGRGSKFREDSGDGHW